MSREMGGKLGCGTVKAGEQDSLRRNRWAPVSNAAKKGLKSVDWTLEEAQLKDRLHGGGRAGARWGLQIARAPFPLFKK